MQQVTDFDGLAPDYWQKQRRRVEQIRQQIADSGNGSSIGRVIPEADDLAIGSGRRMDLTILFTDISGFSSRASWSAAEQEINLRVLNLYFTEMVRVIEDYGGTVEKNTGDGLMAYFEESASTYGVADNSTKRALACALTMLTANSVLIGPILRASGLPSIEFRTSLEYGPITIARIGAPRRFSSNAAIGNAANFASKMLAHLKANEVGLGSAANDRIPESWRARYSTLSSVSTGWNFIATGMPYPLYLYSGRWVLPA